MSVSPGLLPGTGATPVPLAVVVLAHADPAHFHRLVLALGDAPVFVHCDAKTPAAVYDRMVDGAPRPVTAVPRRSTSLASWSLVAAELAGLRAALDGSSAAHIAVLSGADYPLLPPAAMHRELARWEGRSWLWNQPLPMPDWDTPRHPDGGLWRLRHRFLTRDDQIVYLHGIPVRPPWRRSTPPGVELRAASQWKVYARHHVERLLAVVAERPDLVRFWRTTLVPDETFVASVLGSPSLLGADAIAPCHDYPWYLHWEDDAEHPEWLTVADHGDLVHVQSSPPTDPATAAAGQLVGRPPRRKLFARKFSTDRSSELLDRIDAELLS